MDLIDMAHDERESRLDAEKTLEQVRERVKVLAEAWHCWYMSKRPVVGEAKAAMADFYELAKMCGVTSDEIREIADKAIRRADRILEIMERRLSEESK